MNKWQAAFATGLLIALASMPASATYNSTVTGTVTFVQQIGPSIGYAAETITFALDNQPNVSCGGFQGFTITPTTVPDAQTRKNMLAMLLTAKTMGASIVVAYDNLGGFCEGGRAGVYYITLL